MGRDDCANDQQHVRTAALPMIWIAPSEKDTANATLESRLWGVAEQFRPNSGLKAQEYPVRSLASTSSASPKSACGQACPIRFSLTPRKGEGWGEG